MCLSTGIEPTAKIAGAEYVQRAMSSTFGAFGPAFITISMILFAFTTLIGNLYYVDTGLAYLNKNKMPGKKFMVAFRILCAGIIFLGAISPMDACWALADIMMGGMALINIPACLALGKVAVKCAEDYEKQLRLGKDPVFHAADIGIDDEKLDYWK